MSYLLRRHDPPGSAFGDAVLVAFLLAQVIDGAFTYLGVIRFGPTIEANPLIVWLVSAFGLGPALASAKVLAGSFGIALHLTALHHLVAFLTGLYLAIAILPWAAVLFF